MPLSSTRGPSLAIGYQTHLFSAGSYDEAICRDDCYEEPYKRDALVVWGRFPCTIQTPREGALNKDADNAFTRRFSKEAEALECVGLLRGSPVRARQL